MSTDEKLQRGRSRPGGSAVLAGHSVARVGYGAMQLGRLSDDRDAALALVRDAVARGVSHIDTAQFYDDGFVNSVIAEAISAEDGVVLVSKIGADPDPQAPMGMRIAQRPHELRASVEDNLRTLGLEQIPVVNLRRLEVGHSAPAGPEQHVDLDDQLTEMIALREEGKIGSIGLSAVTIDSLRQALPAGIACVQNAYNVLARSDEPLLELCEDEGIAFVPFFPLGSAYPIMPNVTENPLVIDIARSLGVAPSQVGLAWLLQHSPTTLLIPGTASLEHLDSNLAAGVVHFATGQVEQLDQLDQT